MIWSYWPEHDPEGVGPAELDAGGGATDEDAGGGATDEEAGGGATDEDAGGGATDEEAGGGATEEEAGGGATDEETTPDDEAGPEDLLDVIETEPELDEVGPTEEEVEEETMVVVVTLKKHWKKLPFQPQIPPGQPDARPGLVSAWSTP